MEKYNLREGEKFIKEYVDNEGKCVIVFKDKEGNEMHGWVLDLDNDVAQMVEEAAAREGVDPQTFIERALTAVIEKHIEEEETRKAIEEISD